ncbi:hypothetical protein ELI15_14025 [Rhizobium ruizarguesonis]|uniref:hypothetical protein n=1 Tax=Rhizobium ruizarguesonis TaxID=2081791 RepID=UPI00103187F3|nr:hypothetical protein [Rhizobium ruizarguesonis]TAW65407.1 hypothetical protein ELI15_14025 [Rhizobium ruizarguesonis]
MPRKSSGQREGQRKRQERYRQRLAEKREPEVAELDTAVAAALARLVLSLEAKTAVVGSKAVLDQAIVDAVAHLRSAGFSGKASGRLLYRRLVWLKETFKNPDATWLQKRGCNL